MKRNQQIQLIKEAYSDIPDLSDGWKDIRETLFNMNLTGERRHRNGHSSPADFSANLGAKYFVVKHLLDEYREPDRFTVDDIISIRNEVLYAQAWAKKYHAELTEWARKYRESFEQVDYAKLMQEPALVMYQFES